MSEAWQLSISSSNVSSKTGLCGAFPVLVGARAKWVRAYRNFDGSLICNHKFKFFSAYFIPAFTHPELWVISYSAAILHAALPLVIIVTNFSLCFK